METVKRKIALRSMARNDNLKTTVAGLVAAAVLAIPGLDLDALLAGDPVQIARVLAAVLVAVIGWLATKRNKDGTTTAVGAIAAALYASSGELSAVVTAVIIAVYGYTTNKTPKEKDRAG